MKRTTIYLEPDLELPLKREARRQKRPMADLIRDALRRYLGEAPRRRPPGAGAFASGRKQTAADVDRALSETGFGGKS
jgi:hypothetical protein